jgi:hypothetical protein
MTILESMVNNYRHYKKDISDMESNLTDGLDFVESTVNGYIKPDA